MKNKRRNLEISISKSYHEIETQDAVYWSKKTPEERLDMVERLRLESGKFIYEYPSRLRRTIEVVREKQG